MFVRLSGFAVIGLALAAFTIGTAGEKKDQAEYKSITGVIRSVDAAKGMFTIAVPEGKDCTLLVNESTKFVGPAGGSRGMGKAGLKDDTMVKGSEVRVLLAADNKAALEVHLPKRKSADNAKDG